MPASPAFQFYPDKWNSHTGHLSDSAYRIYHQIICWMWQHSPDQCSCPSDPEAIAVLLGTSCERIANALDEIQNPHCELLKMKRTRLHSNGLKKEAKKQAKRRAQTRTAAKLRWDRDKQQMRSHTKPDANASTETYPHACVSQCPPSPSPSPTPTPYSNTDPLFIPPGETKKTEDESARKPAATATSTKPKRSRQFTKPTPAEVTAYGQQIDFQIDGAQFCDFYAAKGWLVGRTPMRDWKAAVRTWKRNPHGGNGKIQNIEPTTRLKP